MTSVPTTAELPDVTDANIAATGLMRFLQAVETRLSSLTERANPILVKETRQALKSRQFLVTFLVVLAACWIASFAGVAMIGSQIFYGASGPQMLLAYFAILAFPLALIVPFSAFRSLAAEQEDNTYDLLSITTLTSRQIVTGKLCSAIVQMIVYLSAVSPCIAFTFLLRGVDVPTTAFLLVMAVLGSLGLSMIALFVGAASRVKHTQIVTSVALILGLFGAFSGSIGIASEVLDSGFPRDPDFWAFLLLLGTIYVTTFGLLHAAAAAQIAFPSENRSTPIRRWMMAQQACFVGAIVGILYAFNRGDWDNVPEIALVATVFASFYWYGMGALMTSEWPHLSRRVQRTLPQSTAGRTVLSFFNPGPGTGYMFAVSNLTALVLFALMCVWITSTAGARTYKSFETIGCALALCWGYVVAYLGLGLLFIGFLRRWMYVSLTAGFLFHAILLMAGVGVPMTIQITTRSLRNEGWTLLQTSNPFWTMQELTRRGPGAVYGGTLIVLIVGLAVLMLILNMRSVAIELRRHRVTAPIRVIEEEAMLHPEPVAGPSNPWDADEIKSEGKRD